MPSRLKSPIAMPCGPLPASKVWPGTEGPVPVADQHRNSAGDDLGVIVVGTVVGDDEVGTAVAIEVANRKEDRERAPPRT